MSGPKVQFSPSELRLLMNTDFILTKNKLLHSIKNMFEYLQSEMQNTVEIKRAYYGHEVFSIGGKVSRGENYMGLPYLVLDYPRQFDSISVFAIRTFFWWGNFFSSTLQLAGQYKEDYLPAITHNYAALARRDYYIGVGEDPWVHHFEEDNYKKISSLSEDEFIDTCHGFEHLKIAAQWPVQDVQFVTEDLMESWQFLVKLCLSEE